MKTNLRKPELLAPAANPEVLRLAIAYGADAVYLGGEAFSLRAKADNFTLEEMAESIRYAHDRGRKVYVTANIFAHEGDLSEAADYFQELEKIGPDALLISDPGMFRLARAMAPKLPIHISTQANNTNHETVLFWQSLGAERVVLGRELSLREIEKIREAIGPTFELEAFVHGAMCISYSGRCLLSNVLTGRDANQGACTHPCRWKYALAEETRPGVYFPMEENDRGSFIFNSKDLNMIAHLPELIRAGIDSFKIEGRMKTALYVATTVRAYRRAIDDLFSSEERYAKMLPWYERETGRCTNRGFCTGFFFGKPSAEDHIYEDSTYRTGSVYLGTVEAVEEDGTAVIRQKNKFTVGEEIELMKPDGTDLLVRVERIRDAAGQDRESAPHPKELLRLTLSEPAEPFDILRRNTEDGMEED